MNIRKARAAVCARRLEHVPVMSKPLPRSWPGLSRPSTSFSLNASKKDVDARDTRRHDAEQIVASPFLCLLTRFRCQLNYD